MTVSSFVPGKGTFHLKALFLCLHQNCPFRVCLLFFLLWIHRKIETQRRERQENRMGGRHYQHKMGVKKNSKTVITEDIRTKMQWFNGCFFLISSSSFPPGIYCQRMDLGEMWMGVGAEVGVQESTGSLRSGRHAEGSCLAFRGFINWWQKTDWGSNRGLSLHFLSH